MVPMGRIESNIVGRKYSNVTEDNIMEGHYCFLFLFFLSSSFFFFFCRAIPVAYRGSQARGQIKAAAADLCHSHRIAGSEPHL